MDYSTIKIGERMINLIEYSPDMGAFSGILISKIGLTADLSFESQIESFFVRNEANDEPDPYNDIEETQELITYKELSGIIHKKGVIVGFEMGYRCWGNHELIMISECMKHSFYCMELVSFSGDQNDTNFDYYYYTSEIIPKKGNYQQYFAMR